MTIEDILERYHYMPEPPSPGFSGVWSEEHDAWVLSAEVMSLRRQLRARSEAVERLVCDLADIAEDFWRGEAHPEDSLEDVLKRYPDKWKAVVEHWPWHPECPTHTGGAE